MNAPTAASRGPLVFPALPPLLVGAASGQAQQQKHEWLALPSIIPHTFVCEYAGAQKPTGIPTKA